MEKNEMANFVEKGMKITEILSKAGFVRPAKKGEHCADFLGFCVWPGTTTHWMKVWRRFGTIANYTILYTKEEVAEVLNGIDFIKITPTKSGRFCRIRIF